MSPPRDRSRRWRWRRTEPSRPRSGWQRALDYGLTIAIFGLAFLFIARMDEVATRTQVGQPQVHDGDTLTLSGVRMRLRGIDAPEYRQRCTMDGQDYACGDEARRALVALTTASPTTCEGWEQDRYGRLLVSCRAGATDINAEMVRSGWAVSYGAYGAEQIQAREARRGLWRGEFETPHDWRADHRPGDAEPPHDWLGSIWNWLRQLASPRST